MSKSPPQYRYDGPKTRGTRQFSRASYKGVNTSPRKYNEQRGRENAPTRDPSAIAEMMKEQACLARSSKLTTMTELEWHAALARMATIQDESHFADLPKPVRPRSPFPPNGRQRYNEQKTMRGPVPQHSVQAVRNEQPYSRNAHVFYYGPRHPTSARPNMPAPQNMHGMSRQSLYPTQDSDSFSEFEYGSNIDTAGMTMNRNVSTLQGDNRNHRNCRICSSNQKFKN